MTRARRVWIVAVALIVASGAAIVVGHPERVPAAPRVPTEPEALYRCLAASGAFAFGNLRMAAQDYHGELLGDVEIVPEGPAGRTGRPDATPLDRDLVLGAFDACLLPIAFVDADSAAGRGALLALYQYQVSTYWPCLRAHGVDPGPVPAVGQYLSRVGAARLVPFQDGFRGSARQVRTATHACAFERAAAASGQRPRTIATKAPTSSTPPTIPVAMMTTPTTISIGPPSVRSDPRRRCAPAPGSRAGRRARMALVRGPDGEGVMNSR